MSAGYVDLLRRRGAATFVAAGFVGRLPLSMVSLGIVLLVTGVGDSYATAGAMAAAYALATAFIAPLGARWMDRAGQARVLPVLAAGQSVSLILFTLTADLGAPLVLQFVMLVVAGGCAPNVGSAIRARWAGLLQGSPALRSAFALEAVVDEVVFIVGPPLVTTLAVQIGQSFALFVCVALLLGGCVWLSVLHATQPEPRPPTSSHGRQPLISGGFLIVVGVLVLMGGIFGSFEVTTVAFASFLGRPELTGLVLALYAFGSLLSGLVLGMVHLTARLDRQMFVFTAVLAVVTLPLPLVAHIVPLMIAAFLAGMAVSPVLIVTVTIVEHLVPAERLTEALTMATSGIAVGLAVAAPVSGALVDTVGAHSGYFFMAGCAVTAFLLTAATLPVMARSPLGGAQLPDHP
jgi:predicted MFS family arabinose efflux permease